MIPKIRDVYRHLKRGSTYIVVGIAKEATNGRSGELVVYQCLEDGTVWSRELSEFMDGRFRLLSDSEKAASLSLMRFRMNSPFQGTSDSARLTKLLGRVEDDSLILQICIKFLAGTPVADLEKTYSLS